MNPIIFKIGSFEIKWYSLLIIVAILIATSGIAWSAKKFKIDKNFLLNLIFWTLIFGIIGARIYFVIFNWDYYSQNLSEIYKIWHGGLAIHGGLIAGILTLIIYCKKYKVNSLLIMDICAPWLLVAQAIGRWGNFFNGEAYGTATTLAHLRSLKFIPDFVINGMEIGGVYYTPTFYYESLWCILGFLVIMIVRKIKYTKIGYQVGLYFIWYSVGRFLIESMRLDSLMIGNFKIAQIVSIVLFIVGILIIGIQSKKPKFEDLYNEQGKLEVNF